MSFYNDRNQNTGKVWDGRKKEDMNLYIPNASIQLD